MLCLGLSPLFPRLTDTSRGRASTGSRPLRAHPPTPVRASRSPGYLSFWLKGEAKEKMASVARWPVWTCRSDRAARISESGRGKCDFAHPASHGHSRGPCWAQKSSPANKWGGCTHPGPSGWLGGRRLMATPSLVRTDGSHLGALAAHSDVR